MAAVKKAIDQNDTPILRVENLTKVFGSGLRRVVAVDNVSFSMQKGEIISLLGESGSGKTTTARLILRLSRPTSGNVYFRGQNISGTGTRRKDLIGYWNHVQAIFQDPFSSFNSFYKVETLLNNAFRLVQKPLTEKEKREEMLWALETVGLNAAELISKRPHELSGGQRQRIMVARALIIKPDVLIADEPTSMIDASSRAGILNILLKLRDEMGMSIIFITHDLGMAYYTSDRLYIMNQGKIVESGTAEQVVHNPQNEYTKKLLEDVPTLENKWAI